jgi:hypothetical protein
MQFSQSCGNVSNQLIGIEFLSFLSFEVLGMTPYIPIV